MTSDDIFVLNGKTNTELGWYVSDIGRPWSKEARERGVAAMRGVRGQVPSAAAHGTPRVTPVALVPIRGEGSTVSGRQALLDRLWDALEGMVEVEWTDQPGRVRRCRVDIADAQALRRESSWVESSGHLRVTFEIVEDNPVAWARESSVLAIGSTPTPIPLVTATSTPLFRFAGAFTGVVITYRGASGRILSTLTLGGEVGAEDFLQIDCSPYAGTPIVLSEDGTLTDRTDLFLAGDMNLAFDPRDGDLSRGVWPTIEANRSGVVEYAEAWS